MKINIDIDLTPEEARKIMGLPDLEPMQAAMIEKVQEKMTETIDNINDPEYLMKKFFPVGIQAMDQFQQFFSGITKMAGSTDKEKPKPKPRGKT